MTRLYEYRESNVQCDLVTWRSRVTHPFSTVTRLGMLRDLLNCVLIRVIVRGALLHEMALRSSLGHNLSAPAVHIPERDGLVKLRLRDHSVADDVRVVHHCVVK